MPSVNHHIYPASFMTPGVARKLSPLCRGADCIVRSRRGQGVDV